MRRSLMKFPSANAILYESVDELQLLCQHIKYIIYNSLNNPRGNGSVRIRYSNVRKRTQTRLRRNGGKMTLIPVDLSPPPPIPLKSG